MFSPSMPLPPDDEIREEARRNIEFIYQTYGAQILSLKMDNVFQIAFEHKEYAKAYLAHAIDLMDALTLTTSCFKDSTTLVEIQNKCRHVIDALEF
jgi:hypothetical protein